MKALICEMCQGNDLVKENGLYVCQHCGTKYSVEEARKLLVSVTIDKTEEIRKTLALARRAKENKDTENARIFYGRVMQEQPDNWEAVFFYNYFRAVGSHVTNIESAAEYLINCMDEVADMIAKLEPEEQAEAVTAVTRHCVMAAQLFGRAAQRYFMEHTTAYDSKAHCERRIKAAYQLLAGLENELKFRFRDKTEDIVYVQKASLQFVSDHRVFIKKHDRYESRDRLSYQIRQQDSDYVAPSVFNYGCYVATAVYGSYDCPQVWTLRRFRDETLAASWYGRAFIRLYYALSPTLVKWFGKTSWFRSLCKPPLDRMVKRLNARGVADTPYKD